MKLAERKSGFSFYESFSDLIFNSLVLFIVLVLFLVLNVNRGVRALQKNERDHQQAVAAMESEAAKVRAEQAKLVEENERQGKENVRLRDEQARLAVEAEALRSQRVEISRLSGSNRFAGQGGPTEFYLAFDGTTGAVRFVPIPTAIHQRLFSTQQGEALREWQAVLPSLDRLSVDQLQEIIRQIRHHRRYKDGTRTRYADRQGDIGWTTQLQMSEIASGLRDASGKIVVPPDEYAKKLASLRKWDNELGSLLKLDALEHPEDPKGAPELRFSSDDQTRLIQLGRTSVSAQQFRDFLKAFGGGGLIVEYLSHDGSPKAPPPWVIKDVLVPAGYVNRSPLIESVR